MTLANVGPVLLVGAGKMGGAMLDGWLGRGLDPAITVVLDPSPPDEVRDLIASRGVQLNPDLSSAPAPGIVVVAVKPQLMDDVLPTIADQVQPGTVVVSIAAGTTIARLEAAVPEGTAVIRAMPNTPAAIGRGISVCVANARATEEHRAQATALLEASGEVAWIDDERQIDAVTAVSGSGPAYVFLLTECMTEAGVEAGLPADLAARLARATVSGAGELMHKSPLDPSVLRQNVTSPGGTTAAALEVLMGQGGLKPLMARAVAAAQRRARELAG